MFSIYKSCLQKIYPFLYLIGLKPDPNDDCKSMLQKFRNHRVYTAHSINLNIMYLLEVAFIVTNLYKGELLEVTYCMPCMTLCLLAIIKTFMSLYYASEVNDIIETLDRLSIQTEISSVEKKNIFIKKTIKTYVFILSIIRDKLRYLCVTGLTTFAVSPLYVMWDKYHQTGQVVLEMPFRAVYPFDEYNMNVYPIVYIHQVFTAFEAVFFVYGPDCFFFTCATFIHIYFLVLQFDTEELNCDSENGDDLRVTRDVKNLVFRHLELIRCVDLLEKMFTKTIFTNVSLSSLIICVTGFNMMVLTDIVIAFSFAIFLSFGLLQIFLYCYFGDNIMMASTQISSAIYKSKWYNLKAADRKGLCIMLMRAQKPCRLTACGFCDINLGTFTSVLSRSWSYFALLRTIYYN